MTGTRMPMRDQKQLPVQVREADVDLEAIGQEMAALKQQLQEQAKSGSLPPPDMVALRS